jgi:hypothetical protein
MLHGKVAEPPQLYPLAPGQRGRHFIEKRRDDALDVRECQVPIIFRQAVDEFRTSHEVSSPAVMRA